jgi:hypothetical protein
MNVNDDKSFDDSLSKRMMDAKLTDLFDAFREAGNLYKSATSQKVKRSAKNIQTSIKLSLAKLCPMGFHAPKWLEEEIKWSQFRHFTTSTNPKTKMRSPKLSKGKARGKIIPPQFSSPEFAEIVTAIKKEQAAKFNSQYFS